MGMFDLFRRKSEPTAQSRPYASAGQAFAGLDDPDLLDFVRNGSQSAAGAYVTASKSLQNMALLRCVTLISESIGMLPLNLIERGDEKRHAVEHPVYKLLKHKPNSWQTPYEFKSQIELAALLHGNGYARVIRSRGQIVALVPMDSKRVEAELTDQWEMKYRYTRKDGTLIPLSANEVFHLRDLSEDGITGLSRVKLAREAIGIALQAERAAARLFKEGVMAGGALSHPGKLSDEAFGRLKTSVDEKKGADKAGDWFILEEGMKAEKWANTAVEGQHIENRNHQIEELARAFGIPRPLLMMDDTSWGSGIEQLAIFFVQYALQHWFTAWEQAIARTLLSNTENEKFYAKFNEKALLRGTLKDQADFLVKALGAGGQATYMTQNEARDVLDMPRSKDEGVNTLRGPNIRNGNEPIKTT